MLCNDILEYFTAGNNDFEKYNLIIKYAGYAKLPDFIYSKSLADRQYVHKFMLILKHSPNITTDFIVCGPTDKPKDINTSDFISSFQDAFDELMRLDANAWVQALLGQS